MQEVIRNAWTLGWQSYINAGKLPALLLIALLLFWFHKKENRRNYDTLFLYTTLMTICCIFPFTAILLMTYQTKFYDYQWIWNLVPVTIVIALTGTHLWSELTEKYNAQKAKGRKCVGIAVVLFAVIWLSGSMGHLSWDVQAEAGERQETEKVLEVIEKSGQNKDVVLWAPQSIMEYARMLDGSVRLPYGRNMWDPALNAYSYETYTETENTLYAWMCHVQETGEGTVIIEEPSRGEDTEATENRTVTGVACLEMAIGLGVNHILLPGNLQPEVLAEWEKELGLCAESVEGYYLFRIE